MDIAISPANLLRYFGQILVVIAAAETGLRMMRPESARVRLGLWRLAIVVCLLLPLLPIRDTVEAAAASSAATIIDIADLTRLDVAGAASRAAVAAMLTLLPWLVIAGTLARAAWLGLGLLRLRQLRAESRPMDLDDAHTLHALHTLKPIAPHAELRWHDTVAQPVTFGLRRPLVLLPPRVADLEPDAQRAIVCHELLHVARRDWAWTLIEEAIRTAFWWHPAMWWALAQVHLQREQAIDARVVSITGARSAYMRALMLFADQQSPAAAARATAIAIPFIRRRHLAARLRQLAQEVPMSRLRLTVAVTAFTAIIASASWAGVRALPLHAQEDQPVKLDADHKPTVLKEVKPVYSPDAFAAKVQGEVVLEVRIAKDGTVAGVRVVKGVPMLNKASIDAARQWTFEPVVIDGENVEALCNLTMRFTLK